MSSGGVFVEGVEMKVVFIHIPTNHFFFYKKQVNLLLFTLKISNPQNVVI